MRYGQYQVDSGVLVGSVPGYGLRVQFMAVNVSGVGHGVGHALLEHRCIEPHIVNACVTYLVVPPIIVVHPCASIVDLELVPSAWHLLTRRVKIEPV